MNALAYSLWFILPASLVAGIALLFTVFLFIQNLLKHASYQAITLVERVNLQLPQTQCGQCGFDGCRPYAEAIVDGEGINRCPPGGRTTINALALLMNQPAIELDPSLGNYTMPAVAIIREAECIGCTKCIQVCPVDAILGAAKLMHTVITSECTGCDLCAAPCPVDCIDMQSLPQRPPQWQIPKVTSSSTASLTSGDRR